MRVTIPSTPPDSNVSTKLPRPGMRCSDACVFFLFSSSFFFNSARTTEFRPIVSVFAKSSRTLINNITQAQIPASLFAPRVDVCKLREWNIAGAVLARMSRSNILCIHNDAGNYPQVAGVISTRLKIHKSWLVTAQPSSGVTQSCGYPSNIKVRTTVTNPRLPFGG